MINIKRWEDKNIKLNSALFFSRSNPWDDESGQMETELHVALYFQKFKNYIFKF
jgi:CMP-2-keto-3-deoxyoctulosonic acid synthetase